MILLFIFLLMSCCFFLSSAEDYLPRHYHKPIVWTVIVAMVLISGTRPGTNVSDYAVYEEIFYNFDSTMNQISVEQTFLLLCELVYHLGGTIRWVIWVYALLSIPLKIYALSRMVPQQIFLLAIPIYLANFFQLHDCEQMRIAAALAITMYAMLLQIEGKRWQWILLLIVAATFHHTALALFVPLALTPRTSLSMRWRWGLFAMIVVGVACWGLKINPVTTIPIPYIEAKMALYELAISKGEHPDVLIIHPIVLLRIITFCYVLYFYDTIYEQLKCINMVLVCEALGLFCWFGLSQTSVFAVRMSELFEVTEVILFASVIYTVKPVWLAKIYPCLFALYLFVYGCWVNQFGFYGA